MFVYSYLFYFLVKVKFNDLNKRVSKAVSLARKKNDDGEEEEDIEGARTMGGAGQEQQCSVSHIKRKKKLKFVFFSSHC